MGRDKAFVELAGEPLLAHAVRKLGRVAREVRILGTTPAYAAFAPLVPDRFPGCGPVAGIEAALFHSAYDWNLILPVDTPFLPAAFLDQWVRAALSEHRNRDHGVRARMFSAEGRPQPTLCLLHRGLRPFLTASLESGQYRLLPALQQAASALAEQDGHLPGAGLWNLPLTSMDAGFNPQPLEPWHVITPAQLAGRPLWFANLNTPEELLHAESHTVALDQK